MPARLYDVPAEGKRIAASGFAPALIVENGRESAELARHLLRRAGLGARALVVEGFQDAMLLLAQRGLSGAPPFALAIVSQELAGTSGLALMSLLRGRPEGARTRVVVLAASADEEVERACIRDRSANYLLRSPDPERLGDQLAGLVVGYTTPGVTPPA